MNKSTLFIVATPIGNMKDITYRAIEILKEVDLIACEDTRQTIKLLNEYGVKKKLVSYHKYSNLSKIDYFLDLLKNGHNIALVSDAGMPLIADPGNMLVKKAIENNFHIEVIPAISPITSALVLSNMDLSNFVFAGWMPRKTNKRMNTIEKYLSVSETVVFLESCHRIHKSVSDIYDYSKSKNLLNLKISIAREMTKLYEEVIRGDIETVNNIIQSRKEIKGEIVLILGI